MNANEILTAAAATLDQRGKDYDQPEGERSMGRIVAAFNVLTGHTLTEAQGWQFMACLKLVRMSTAADLTDSAIDCAAYAALAGEALGQSKEKEGRAPETDADRWIQWHGGECPVDGDVDVEIRLSDGTETIEAARMLRWDNLGNPDDIVAYRLAEQEAPVQKTERWVPKDGERYFFVNLDASEVIEVTWIGSGVHRQRAAFGNVFRTRKEAEDKLSEIIGKK